MTLTLAALAVVACGLGALTRYAISQLGAQSRWPWPTLAANVLGSALLGAVAAAVLVADAPAGWLLVLGGGFAGGLSTVSTLAVDVLLLWREGERLSAVTYVALTLATGFAAAAAGWTAAVVLWG